MNLEQYKTSKTSIRALKVDSYAKSYFVVALNILMLFVAIRLFLSANTASHIAGILLWALQMNHSYLIVHECCHGSFFKKARTNEILGNIFAFFALLPFYSRRLEHLTHHRMAGTFDEPSTNRAVKRFQFINPKAEFFISICWKLWVPIFSFNEQVMLWGLPFKEGTSPKITKRARIALGTYGLLLVICTFIIPSHNPLAVIASFFPAFYAYMMLVEFFNLPHHLSSPFEDRKGNVPYHEQSYYSRSCAPMQAPFGPWLNLNFNYHIAHHLYPAVHWTKLRKAHEIMAEIDPSVGDVSKSELEINVNLRKQPLRKALSKFYDYQRSQVAV